MDKLKEKLNNLIEVRKSYWTAFIALTAGIATLLLSVDSIVKIILITVGFIFWVFIFFAIGKCNIEINKYLNQL
ncbi:MAG: hypothetical protein PHC34_02965 [Candidatus Gastranaerophilales bacterium]|nr:hypothetical protein [Candidatus Gastranaerophilales bacterium]